MAEALLVHEESGDRWSIGDLRRDRSPMPRVDRLLAGLEASPPARGGVDTRLDSLERRVDEFERRLRELAGRGSAPASGYTLFLCGARGYDVVDRDGVAPELGAPVIVGDERYVVEGTRRSPFPSDARPCLVLSPLPPEHPADGAATGAA